MTDRDDDALTWEGDDHLAAPRQRAPRLIADADDETAGDRQGGAFALVALGLLGGVALLETVGWLRSITTRAMQVSLDPGSGSALELASFVGGVVGRAAAVAAPAVWFVVTVLLVREPPKRLVWLLLGALVLLPWPVLLGLR